MNEGARWVKGGKKDSFRELQGRALSELGGRGGGQKGGGVTGKVAISEKNSIAASRSG